MACSTNYFPPGQTLQDINGFPVRFADMTQLSLYAERVGGGSGATDVQNCKNFVMAALAVNRLTYCKNHKVGDCGTPKAVSLGVGASTLKYGGAATGAAAGLGGLGALGPSFAAGTAGATALGAATLGIGLIALPILAIVAHHAQAVAQEQATICGVSNGWNAFMDAAESAIVAGRIGVQDAIAQMGTLYAQLSQALDGVKKGMNAGGYFQRALDALQPWNKEVVFPSLVQPAQGTNAGATTGAASGGNGLLIGGGVLAAKLLGAF